MAVLGLILEVPTITVVVAERYLDDHEIIQSYQQTQMHPYNFRVQIK